MTEGGTTANFTVNTATTYQTWKGWGGTFNEKGWTAMAGLSAADKEMVMKLLFDPNDGIGFDWGRIPIGPSDYADERYHLSSGPGEFDITHDESSLIPYIHAAQAINDGVKYWASPWTPPPWAKDNGLQDCSDPNGPGCMKNGDYDKGIFNKTYYQEYADFFVDWITAYEAAGIPIHSVSPQNEPGWSQGYPTCAFGPATDSTQNSAAVFRSDEVSFGPFIEALHTKLQAMPTQPGIWFGTMSNDSVFDAYWNSLSDKTKVIGVALQWETLNRITPGHASNTTFPAHFIIMQSEHKCGNYPWLGAAPSKEAADSSNFWAAEAPNNHNYGLESWGMFKDWIGNGVNIYSAWNMVLDTGGFNLDQDRPWPQNALIVVKPSEGTFETTSYYNVFRHVAQYVHPEAVRVDVTGDALAFKNVDGSVVTIMHNPGAEAEMTLSVDGTMLQFTIPASGWATVTWGG